MPLMQRRKLIFAGLSNIIAHACQPTATLSRYHGAVTLAWSFAAWHVRRSSAATDRDAGAAVWQLLQRHSYVLHAHSRQVFRADGVTRLVSRPTSPYGRASWQNACKR
jgi:hypothetical protein